MLELYCADWKDIDWEVEGQVGFCFWVVWCRWKFTM